MAKEKQIYEDGAYVFEVETEYKSGRKRTDFISANSEEEMWKIYDKSHNANLIEWSGIIDCSLQ